MDAVAGSSCAAHGCPLLGSFGVSGRWYCACHRQATGQAVNAITATLVQNREKCEHVVMLRQTHAGYAEIFAAENELIELTHEVGKQYGMEGV
ncbi:hypothetical protein [Burkholderia plantarii]|uniref:hypothetical protein n=1 Tax=Burkholderia plantarii TaxID=41899 RepID=UPI0008708E75|nr:hypothetical protein [Burkholderia plantarii]